MAKKLTTVQDFKGYVSKPDITNIGPGFLVKGSRNCTINSSSRMEFDKGYRLDGAVSSVAAPITSSFDFENKSNGEVNIRVGFRDGASNGKMQFRYSYNGTTTWTDLFTGLSTDIFRFTTFWDDTEQVRLCLMVNGTGTVYVWNGAVATVLSNTATTITKSGTQTWAEAGFNITAGKSVVVNGVTYTYTGGETTTTLTGLAGLPAFTVGASVHQLPVTFLTSTITSLPANFYPNLIATLDNQVYYGTTLNQNIWVSKFGNYKDVSFTALGRKPAEGATARLDAMLIGFAPQEDFMVIHAGLNQIYETKFTASADGVTEAFAVKRKKTGQKQAARSQEFLTKIYNDTIFVTNEPVVQTYGRVQNNFAINNLTNISDIIQDDLNIIDYTGGSIFYHRSFIHIALPATGVNYRYNFDTKAWQAPYDAPITRYYTVNGELYAHSSTTSESYRLFYGGAARSTNDTDGLPITYVANFSYMNFGSRTAQKTVTEMYSEGYIDVTTDVTAYSNFETSGCGTLINFTIDGEDQKYVCLPTESGSFGKHSFGSEPIGGLISENLLGLPPKFRLFSTTVPVNFYEVQPQYYAFGTNVNFQLLSFGYDVVQSKDDNIINKQ